MPARWRAISRLRSSWCWRGDPVDAGRARRQHGRCPARRTGHACGGDGRDSDAPVQPAGRARSRAPARRALDHGRVPALDPGRPGSDDSSGAAAPDRTAPSPPSSESPSASADHAPPATHRGTAYPAGNNRHSLQVLGVLLGRGGAGRQGRGARVLLGSQRQRDRALSTARAAGPAEDARRMVLPRRTTRAPAPVRASISRRSVWWPFWMRIRKAICARIAR